jgi:hypothetical protein
MDANLLIKEIHSILILIENQNTNPLERKMKEKQRIKKKERRARELDSTKPYKWPPNPRKAGYKSF